MGRCTRRRLLRDMAALAGAATLGNGLLREGLAAMTQEEQIVPVRRATPERNHHFFGYYDKFPWDATGRYLLAPEVPFIGRQPEPDEPLVVGMVDLDTDEYVDLDETLAWNWQQGTMLQWLPTAPDRRIIYNSRRDGRFVSVVRDVKSGDVRTIPFPIYAVSRDGKSAVSLNFSRVHRTRPGYGYDGIPDAYEELGAPEDDGIYRVDLETGEYGLIISLAEIVEIRHNETMEDTTHWFNHLQFNTDDSRFLFLHRWRKDKGWYTRLFTADPDGKDIHCVSDHNMISHFDWRDETHILAWATRHDRGNRYFLFTDQSDEIEIVGDGVLTVDGHCSYSPDRQWILTDTYPNKEHDRTLLLFHPESERRIDIGKFYSPPELNGPWRCDLHPRWNRDGTQVCIDSAHEPTRQMYVLDVSGIVEA